MNPDQNVRPANLMLTLTPDDADALSRVILGDHAEGLEMQKTRVFAERLRAFVVERMNAPGTYQENFDDSSEILAPEEVRRFLENGDSYRIAPTVARRSA